MIEVQAVPLRDGGSIPQVGFGVFRVLDDVVEAAVSSALKVGYRHIDTASFYRNEAAVGRAIANSGIPRDELFIITKLWNSDHDDPHAAFQRSLDFLGLEAVDLYLIHWPVPMHGTALNAWRGLVEIVGSGRSRSIGVSNFEIEHLQELVNETGVVPAVNQVELHPLHQRRELREFCRQYNIAVEAWGPLTRVTPESVKVLSKIGESYNKSWAQVILNYQVDIQHGNIIFPKTMQRARMVENASLFNFVLSDPEMAAIDELDEQHHFGADPRTMSLR